MQIQDFYNKNFSFFKKLKLKNLKPTPLYDNMIELVKKKEFEKYKRK